MAWIFIAVKTLNVFFSEDVEFVSIMHIMYMWVYFVFSFEFKIQKDYQLSNHLCMQGTLA